MTDLIIDGDIVVYQACAASEKATKWEDGIWTLHTDEWEAKHKAATHIERVKAVANNYFDIDKVKVAFSSTSNFRKGIYPEYKKNREGKRRPMCIREVVAYLGDKYSSLIWTNIEADDVMGIYATRDKEVVIYSADKDMATIPNCWHMTNTDSKPTKISEEAANRNWFKQALTGDTVDNYKGIKGVGPVKALRILEGAKTEEDMWKRVRSAYLKAGHTVDEALTQTRLARILREGDYCDYKNEVKLWEPANV
jgi:DNA polymerase-1